MLLKPLEEQETADYVIHRLHAAGATRAIFTDDALQAVHRLSQGIPRRINRLCDLAMVVGFAERKPTIDASHLEAVDRELVSLSSPAAA